MRRPLCAGREGIAPLKTNADCLLALYCLRETVVALEPPATAPCLSLPYVEPPVTSAVDLGHTLGLLAGCIEKVGPATPPSFSTLPRFLRSPPALPSLRSRLSSSRYSPVTSVTSVTPVASITPVASQLASPRYSLFPAAPRSIQSDRPLHPLHPLHPLQIDPKRSVGPEAAAVADLLLAFSRDAERHGPPSMLLPDPWAPSGTVGQASD